MWGTRLFSPKNENLSPLISSLKRGTLLSGCVEVPSYDIRGGGRSLGEESIELVSLLTTFYLTVPILKPIYLELNKKAKDKLGLVITGPSGSGSVAGITQ
jgi:hypothetical protein